MSGRRPSSGRQPENTREALGLAPARRGERTTRDDDTRGLGGPPVLRTNLWGGVKLLLLMNILPLVGVAWLAWSWWRGAVSFARLTAAHVAVIAVVIAACALIALSSWVVLPVGRWLRDYPLWHFRQVSRVRWFLPLLGGVMTWLVLWLACAAAVLTAAFVIVTGLIKLARGG